MKQNDPTTYTRILHYTKLSRCPWSRSIARGSLCQILNTASITAAGNTAGGPKNSRDMTTANECGESDNCNERRTQKHLER